MVRKVVMHNKLVSREREAFDKLFKIQHGRPVVLTTCLVKGEICVSINLVKYCQWGWGF